MKTLREATIALALLAGSAAMPAAALADAPAATAAPIPGPFVGAPTNNDPSAGQFTVNFDDQGRYRGTGRAFEHYANFDLGPGRVRQQGRVQTTSMEERRTVNGLFVGFSRQLRDIATPETARVDR